MSVWPGVASHASLSGSEGILTSIAVHVEPGYLEALLEALAHVDFPVNPQIYHNATLEYRYADGRVEREPTTVVEFPAYQSRVEEVLHVLEAYGFSGDCLHVVDMLEGIQGDVTVEPAPAGAAYISRALRRKPVSGGRPLGTAAGSALARAAF